MEVHCGHNQWEWKRDSGHLTCPSSADSHLQGVVIRVLPSKAQNGQKTRERGWGNRRGVEGRGERNEKADGYNS